MRILYGVNGEGLGHATRSRVVIQHLIDRGHEVKVAASGRAFPYLQQHLPDVEQIWGLSFALEHGQVDVVKTVVKNVRGSMHGLPETWRRGQQIAKRFDPEFAVTDFEGFTYMFARQHHVPVISVGNIQMVDRCRHKPEVLKGLRRDYLTARTFVRTKLPYAHHYLITTFFYPALRKQRTTLMPSLLRPEVLAAEPQEGQHLLVYGRISETAIDALRSGGIPSRIYGGREDVTADEHDGSLLYRPFSNESFVEDLRTARGVVASAGYSLMSEAVYLRKPMLALPLAGQFEQAMNARYLEQMGFGTCDLTLDHASLERFLEREHEHAGALATYEQDGNDEALEMVERTIERVVAGTPA
jgi:uncharacterized protein (TIGR00661 family)